MSEREQQTGKLLHLASCIFVYNMRRHTHNEGSEKEFSILNYESAHNMWVVVLG